MRFLGFRGLLLLFGLTIGLLVYGGVEISESLRFPSAKTMTYEQFAAQMPQEGWYHITGGRLEVVNCVWQEDEKTHKIDKIFVPLSSSKAVGGPGETTSVMVEEHDPAMIDTAHEIQQLSGQTAEDFVKKNHDRAFIRRDVEGMIKTGLKSDDSIRAKMAKLDNTSLASNWIMLNEGAHPSLLLGVGCILGGLALAALQVLMFLRRRMSR